jgi:DNA-directed RNA polymerase subunit RPC12/RpoP
MQILKGNAFKKKTGQFGDFELRADKGWKISESFIDYESGLLVVNTTDENKDNWVDTGTGSRIIPTKQYIIDPNSGEILTYQEWSKYFSYETHETISDDGQYKLTTTRIHEPEKNSDGIKEELIDLESGKTISIANSIAFRKEKRENLLEALYRELKQRQEKQSKLDAMPTLVEFYENELHHLKDGDILLNYFNDDFIFQLVYQNQAFHLKRKPEKQGYSLDWTNFQGETFQKYHKIEEFNEAFLTKKDWYLEHVPSKTPSNYLLKKFIIDFFNDLRKRHDFTYSEYRKLHHWENYFYQKESIKPSEYKQYCSNCKKPVNYSSRYPKYICRDCSSKKIIDEEGTELSFSNVGFSGGLRITYRDGDKILKEDTSQIKKLCFIEGKRFLATEARFGGIVIQTEK